MEVMLLFFLGVFVLGLREPTARWRRHERRLVAIGCLAVATALFTHRFA